MGKTYIFTKEIKHWGVETGDDYNPKRHQIIGGTKKLLADGIIEIIEVKKNSNNQPGKYHNWLKD